MLKLSGTNALLRWATGVFGVVLFGWLVNVSPTFKECINTKKSETTHQTPYKNPGIISKTVARIELHAVCVEDWTKEYEGAIGAVATVFIAVFTFTLWGATERLWKTTIQAIKGEEKAAKAADLHARAVVALQLPVLSASPQSPVDGDMEPVGVDGRLPITFAILGAEIRNDGNTSAAPIDLKWGWQVADVLAADPVYTETRIPGSQRIITAGNTEDFPFYLSITLTDTQRMLIEERQAYFWIYASIRFSDFMGTMRETGFCWKWSGHFTVIDGSVVTETYGFSPMGQTVPKAYIKRNQPCDETET